MDVKKFNSRKSFMVPVLIGVMLILAVLGSGDQFYIGLLIPLPTMLYLIWMWFDTYYVIDGDELTYKSALFKGTIDIKTIREISTGKTLYAGLKPSLAGNGLVIKYNKWDDIYLSPSDSKQFVEELKSINPQIKVQQ
jgi:hypothetical protein